MGRFFFLLFFSAALERKSFSVCHRRRTTWAGVTPCLQQQMNSIVAEREGTGGREVEFLSVWLCHKDPWTQANGGKQTKPLVGLRGGHLATVNLRFNPPFCTRWVRMWSLDNAGLAGGLHEMTSVIETLQPDCSVKYTPYYLVVAGNSHIQGNGFIQPTAKCTPFLFFQ